MYHIICTTWSERSASARAPWSRPSNSRDAHPSNATPPPPATTVGCFVLALRLAQKSRHARLRLAARASPREARWWSFFRLVAMERAVTSGLAI